MPKPEPIALVQRRVAEVARAFAYDNAFPAPDPVLDSVAQEVVRSLPDTTPFDPAWLLAWAAADGHTLIVRSLLSSGVSPESTAEPHCKYRPVLLAARAGHLDIVRLFIEAKAQLGFDTGPLGKPAGIWSFPLAQAIMGGHNDVAVLLAQTRAAIVPVNPNAEFLIGLAAEHGVDAVILVLVTFGYNPNAAAPLQELTPLMQAAAHGHTAAVKALLAAGADPNAPVQADPRLAKYSATSALILAAKAGHRAAVETLLGAGADTAITDHRGATAYDWAKHSADRDITSLLRQCTPSARSPLNQLMDAIESDDLPAVRRLIAAGCDLAAKTPVCWPEGARATGGQTPLMRAAELGRYGIVKALLEAGADPTALSEPTDEAEITAVHYAALAGQIEAIRLLMAAVPAKQRQGDLGVTGCPPLQSAAEKGHLAAIKTLHECGASLAGKVGGGCLYKAISLGHEAVARFLLEQGVSPDDSGRYRCPPLIEAVRERREPMVSLLLKADANVNALCEDGWTALNYAQYNSLDSIVRILTKAGGRLAEDLPAKVSKRAPKPAEALPTLPKQYASGEMAKRPKFRLTAGFQSAARRFEAATKLQREEQDSHPGVFLYRAPAKDAVEIVRRRQKKLLDAGCYLFVATRNLTGTETLILAPTDDLYEAIAYVGTHGPNYGLGSENIIDALGDIADDNPFTLWTITHDCLEGQFSGKLRTAKSVATLFAALAPDIVTQGTGTVAALTQSLGGSRPRLLLWWD